MRIFSIIMILFNAFLINADGIVLQGDFSEPDIKNFEAYEDIDGSLDINQIITKKFALTPRGENNVIDYGRSKSAFWVKINIENSNENDQFLKLKEPLIDKVDVYFIKDNKVIKSSSTGASLNFETREVEFPNYFFRVPKGITTCYIRLQSNFNLQVPVTFGPLQILSEKQHSFDLLIAMYLGLMLVMIVYNVFIYFSTRDISYLYYILYILCATLFYASLKGITFQFLWPDTPYINFLIPSFASIINVFGALFLINLLQLKKYLPKTLKYIYVAITVFLSCIILNLFGFYEWSSKISQGFTAIYALFFISIGIYLLKQKVHAAKFFLIAWTLFLVSVVIFILKLNGVLSYTNFTNNVVLLGSALEAILLSFALADRINILKKEKEKEQAGKLEALKENARIIENQKEFLEKQVKEKTSELQKSNNHLSKTLKDLQNAQVSLVESEKMASLGQLTAGVAHEINNPINFVSSNVNPLIRDFEDMEEFISTVLSKTEEKDQVISKEIKDLYEELDIEYTQKEITQLLSGIKEGANRTAEIVKGLKNFSRLDEAAFKTANLEEGLDSTLILLRSNMKGEIELIKNYNGIPDIDCYAGKLNQVFMNLINNSIYAVLNDAKREEKGGGKLILSTLFEENKVVISIEDNGMGMDEKTKNKLFEPFFTTKPVGEGTGLGMSITYTIINEMHEGEVQIESELGKGTKTIIKLPIGLKK